MCCSCSCLCFIKSAIVTDALNAMPKWLTGGMAVGGGMVAVGYAMVINMMATREVWPFFALGFVFAAINSLLLLLNCYHGVCLISTLVLKTLLSRVAAQAAS